MAMEDTSIYDRTMPLSMTVGCVRAHRRRANALRGGLRLKPGWLVLAALAVLPATPLCDSPTGVAMAHKASTSLGAPSRDTELDGDKGAAQLAETHATLRGTDGQVDQGQIEAENTTPEHVDDPAPPIAGGQPLVLAEPREALTTATMGARRVLLVGIDGLRPDALRLAHTPHLDALARAGAYHFDALAGEVTLSGPGWASVLTGVDRHRHGVVDNRSRSLNKLSDWPTVFHRYHRKYPRRTTASLVGWRPINTRLLSNAPVNVKGDGGDRMNTRKSVELLETDPDLGLLFVHLDAVDTAGHRFGHHPKVSRYLRAISKTDFRLGKVLTALNARDDRDEWLVVVTTDHGGSKDGSHGRDRPEQRRVFVLLSGPNVVQGELEVQPRLTDVAATIVEHLSLASPGHQRALEGTALALPEREASLSR